MGVGHGVAPLPPRPLQVGLALLLQQGGQGGGVGRGVGLLRLPGTPGPRPGGALATAPAWPEGEGHSLGTGSPWE